MLFGRDLETRQVTELLADVAGGNARTLVVTGEPGIGKSALLADAARSATGFRVLRVKGAPTDAVHSFRGLRALLQPTAADLERIPQPQAAALAVALALAAGTPQPDHAAAAVASLLAEHATAQPVLVLVDDAHWLDGETLDVLHFAARRLVADAVAIVVAQRSGAVTPFSTDTGAARLDLRGLGEEDARALARSHAPERLGEAALARLLASADGNPLVLVELAARGAVMPSIDASLAERLFGERLGTLSRAAWVALTVAAVGEGEAIDPWLNAAAALGAPLDAWQEAEACGMVRLEPGRVRFRHPLAAAAVRDMVTASDLRAAHAAIAGELSARGDHAGAAWHRAAAAIRPDEEIAQALEATAQESARRSGHLGAALALERAARLSPARLDRARRLVAAAEAARRAQRDADAAAWAAEVLELAPDAPPPHRAEPAPDPPLRDRAELVLAGVDAWHGALEAARSRYHRLAATADRATAADALGRAAAVAVVSGDTSGALQDAEAAFAAGGEPAARETLASVLVLRGELDRARAHLEPVVAHYAAAADHSGAQFAALTLAWVEDFAAATKLIDAAERDARASGNRRDRAQALEIRADIRYRLGQLELARADADASAVLAEDTREPVQLAYSLAILAVVSAARGDEAATREHVARASELGRSHGLRVLDEYTGYALGLLELGRDHAQDALDALERVSDYVATTGRGTAGILFWPADLIEAAIRSGRLELAHDELARLEDQAARCGLLWPRAVLERCRGLLAPADGFDAPFKAALALHARLPLRFEHARTQLAYGIRLQRSDRQRDARTHLLAAMTTFDGIGAHAWRGIAQREYEATGMRRGSRFDARPEEELSARELQFAVLAASGLQNKQIAAELMFSVKTVERYLSSAIKKARVSNRTELAAKLRERGVVP